ncbi:aminotransferase [Solihabitans fulvus]|uniref:Aminotransferase n=2 Tax=Solihabitans fulvus TaxID=1892852 RepID=A0A5B2WLR7_9PSEU|nr:aminotransferase [Solihabitans fulvus]
MPSFGAELDGVLATPAQLAALALTNYGHFTTMLVADGLVRGLALHLARLTRDCRTLFDAALDTGWVRWLVRQAVEHNAEGARAVVVRVTVFDPDLGVPHPGAAARPRVLVTLRPAPGGPPAPLRVRSLRYQRDTPSVKHVGLFGPMLHRRRAQRGGVEDVLFTGPGSRVSEGATWNVGFLDGDRLVWPAAECLPGVTMALLNQVHDGPVAVEPVALDRVPTLRAALATNAAIGVRPLTGIDGVDLPTDPAALGRLRAAYEAVAGEPI